MKSDFNIEWSNNHDLWNIILLPIVFITNIYLLFNWCSHNLDVFCFIFKTYLVLDLIWLILLPQSVMNPKIIYFHHFISIMGVIVIPRLSLELSNIICLTTLTEINTWIRLIRNRTTDFCNLILDLLFVITWFIIRVMIGPYVFIVICKTCFIEPNTINILLVFISFGLNVLTAIWTYQLFKNLKHKAIKYLFYENIYDEHITL